ncbi:glycosyltransferase [Candidatus Sumerlaeota bacterium]|nr:glycosyltransferase [Candidatus Sumerlaeota bacterium]
MKILRVIYDLQIGGVQRMLLKSLPLLKEAGIETEICCLKKEGNLSRIFSQKGFRIHVIPFRLRLDPMGLIRLRRFVSGNAFQIVHSHMYASNMAVNAALFGAKGVRIINGYHSSRPFYSRSQMRMARWTSKIPDRLIAVSLSVKEALMANGLPEEKIALIRNGVMVPENRAPVPDKPPSSPLEMFWAGRFVKQKRVEMLIDLVEACKKENIPVRLTLAGDGHLFSFVEKKIAEKQLGELITLTGWKDDIRPFLRKADIYVSASNREGFPNTLLEACAEGRGFLVSDIPPNAEVLGSREAGFLLNDHLGDWTSILKRLQENRGEIERLSQRAFEIGKSFSMEQTCKKTIRLYEELLEKSGKREE